MKSFNAFLFSVIIIFMITGCYYNNLKNIAPQTPVVIATKDSIICFSSQVLPILQKNCATTLSCHLVELGSYKNIIGDNYVHLGLDATYSKLYYQIALCDPEDRMPPSDREPLSAYDIEIIKRWIDQGSKNELNCK